MAATAAPARSAAYPCDRPSLAVKLDVQEAFAAAGLADCGTWGMHSLRKALYGESGYDILATKSALSSPSTRMKSPQSSDESDRQATRG